MQDAPMPAPSIQTYAPPPSEGLDASGSCLRAPASWHPARDRFSVDVLRKSPAALKIYWIQRVFAGIAAPPPQAPSVEAALAYVRSNRGAVTYVPVATRPVEGTKAVVLR
jgi:hypothetical protein